MKQSGTYLREVIGLLDCWIIRHTSSKNLSIQRSKNLAIQPSKNLEIQRSNDPTIQRSNHLSIQRSNNPTIQPSKNLAIQRSNHPTIQQSNHLSIQRSKNLAIKPSNNLKIQQSILLIVGILTSTSLLSQTENNEVVLSSDLNKATVFFQGVQLDHSKTSDLKPGKQTLVFEKLTDFLDPNSIQVKATGNLTILAVSTRKNYEDKRISNIEIRELSDKLEQLKKKDRDLRDEHLILETDKSLLNRNSSLGGSQNGVKITELKEAYSFMHARMIEISQREAEIEYELEKLTKEMNKLKQEIDSQRSKPVVNYSEVIVEVDVAEQTNATFYFSYISPNASWTPYYDMRSNGIGFPVKLEAKAFVNQTTGIPWNNIDLVLSTNDPYQNTKEMELQPWYINYNNYPPYKQSYVRQIPAFDYAGQKIRGEVIDAATGQSMAFAKVYFSNNPTLSVVTDFDGKFEMTVPKGEHYVNAAYAGYGTGQQYINAPYVKFFLSQNELVMEQIDPGAFWSSGDGTTILANGSVSANYSTPMYDAVTIESYNMNMQEIQVLDAKGERRKSKSAKFDKKAELTETEKELDAANVEIKVVQKDLRVEYSIQSKFTIPSDGIDQRVSIQNIELPANYEYHAAPKLDPSVYLIAQVSGWEKLNLLSGESNIYFDGTFIGKSYVDVNSTKDTLAFSMGKDSKIQVLRSKVSEKSKIKTVGSRQKFDIAWEIKVKNNGGAEIPLLIKDQFPISINEDIKVKQGDFAEGQQEKNTGIILWNIKLAKNQSKSFFFDYSVDYRKGTTLFLE